MCTQKGVGTNAATVSWASKLGAWLRRRSPSGQAERWPGHRGPAGASAKSAPPPFQKGARHGGAFPSHTPAGSDGERSLSCTLKDVCVQRASPRIILTQGRASLPGFFSARPRWARLNEGLMRAGRGGRMPSLRTAHRPPSATACLAATASTAQ